MCLALFICAKSVEVTQWIVIQITVTYSNGIIACSHIILDTRVNYSKSPKNLNNSIKLKCLNVAVSMWW